MESRSGQVNHSKTNLFVWSDVDKCLVISGLSLSFSIIYYVAVVYLKQAPGFLPSINREVISMVQPVLPWLALSWAIITGISIFLRKRSADNQTVVYITLLWYSIPNTVLIFLLGPVTNPLVGIGLVGTGIIMFLLFKPLPATVTFTATILSMITLMAAERMGMLPYAPLLTIQPTIDGRPSDWWVYLFGGISLGLTLAIIFAFAYIVMQLKQHEKQLELLSNTDGLTGINNRRHFMEIAEQECERAKRTNRPLSFIMCDADFFKNVNDTYGHSTGDEVLKYISKVLDDSTRSATDYAGRLGGEEFALLLAETDMESAKMVATRILEQMRNHVFKSGDKEFVVTLSMGLAVFNDHSGNLDDLIETSDRLLYEAKESGRNRIVSSELGSGTQTPSFS